MLAGTPSKRQHESPPTTMVQHDQCVQRKLATAQRMQQPKAYEVVVGRLDGLYQGQRKRRVGR
jgi:hypothetical protein